MSLSIFSSRPSGAFSITGKDTGFFAEWKNDLKAMTGEFIGTTIFLMFSLGAVQAVSANKSLGPVTGTDIPFVSDAARLIGFFYISTGFGLSLFITASMFYRFTGSLFNPSISLALVLLGVLKPLRFLLVGAAQMVGGIAAAAIIDGLTPGQLKVNAELGVGTSKTQGMFIEMFSTAILVMSVLMLAVEKHRFTPVAPIGIGFTLFAVMLFSTEFTGGAVNTARAFGPAVIEGFPSYHWIYWVGETLGGLLAWAFYVFFKYMNFWRVNPGQDATKMEQREILPNQQQSPNHSGQMPSSDKSPSTSTAPLRLDPTSQV